MAKDNQNNTDKENLFEINEEINGVKISGTIGVPAGTSFDEAKNIAREEAIGFMNFRNQFNMLQNFLSLPDDEMKAKIADELKSLSVDELNELLELLDAQRKKISGE